MATCLAFGFLTGGGFAVNTHQNFDRNIPHSFIMIPTGQTLVVYKRKTIKLVPAVSGPASTIPTTPVAASTSNNNEAEKKEKKKNRRQRRKLVSPLTPQIVGDEPVLFVRSKGLKVKDIVPSVSSTQDKKI